MTVKYSSDPTPALSISYTVFSEFMTSEKTYETWVNEREPPLFGSHPDARLMALAASLGASRDVACLDVGAGTGRNTLPLARAGHPTDAIEPAPALASLLESAAKEQKLGVGVVRGSFLDRSLVLPRSKYRLIVLAETCSHFRDTKDLKAVFSRLSELLEPGCDGLINLLFDKGDYEPEEYARQLSQIVWCPIFTRPEIAEATEGLPLDLQSDLSQLAYEREHLPAAAWPPTSWYEWWVSGRDLFEIPFSAKPPPVELRWLTFRRA